VPATTTYFERALTPRTRFIAARLAYVAVVVVATVTQLDFSPDLAAAAQRLARAFTPSLGWRDAIDGLRNAALFGGLGVVWVVTSPSGRVRAEIWRATLVALALSATVEGLQVFSPVRTASIVDVTTNTLGACGGALAMALLVTAVVRARDGHFLLGVPTFLLAGAYTLAVLCEALTPLFRSDRLPGVEGGPLTLLDTALDRSVPIRPGEVPLLDVLLYAPAGFLVVTWLIERVGSARRVWPAVAGVGAGLAFAAEFIHGTFGLSIRWEAAATHAVAVGAGAWAAQRWLPVLRTALRGWPRARAALVAYAALLVLWGWRPFLPKTDAGALAQELTAAHLVPLASLSGRVDVFSALHVAQQFLLYLPLGSVLAVWPLRGRGGFWPAVWLAVGIEAGHIVIADRFFDVTNALVACAGLGIGWLIVQRSGFAPHGESSVGERH